MSSPFVPTRAARAAVALLGLAAPARWAAAQPAAEAHPIAVEKATHVSKVYEKRPHAEVFLAADPGNRDRLLAGSMIDNPDAGFSVVAYASADGGKSWAPTFEKAGNARATHADPACAFGPDGTAYFAELAGGDAGSEVRASADGGRTWSPPTALRDLSDRPFLVADCTNGRFRGRLYCTGDARGLGVYRSLDGGRSFEPPARPAVTGSEQGKMIGLGAALSDGTLVLPCHVLIKATERKYALRIVRSNPGGESFLPEQVVADYHGDHIQSGVLPMLAAGPETGTFADRLYLVWCDRTEAGLRVMLSVSKDRGARWSTPIALSDEPRGSAPDTADASDHAYVPAVAVNRHGVVAVTWYDATLRDKTLRSHVRLRASLDGGATWLPSVAVSEAVSTHLGARDQWVGHTAGLAADAEGVFHPLWVDARTGIRQVYTASVAVR